MQAGLARAFVLALLWLVPCGLSAQTTPSTSTPSQQLLKPAELEQLVAPIALHPDPLLAEMLMASTYPLEVVQADRWAKANKGLKGDALTNALAKQGWDDSIKSLVQVPEVLNMMSEQLEWTQKLGDAVLAQQEDLMDAIQRLRVRARDNGKLETTKQQTVTVLAEGDKQYVAIEPASPNEIYVPYYEPSVVYGEWPYPDYAPYYFAPPYGYIGAGLLTAGIAFGTAALVRHAFWGNCNWRGRHVTTLPSRSLTNVDRGRWQHNPDHRHGVRYNNADVRQKFAKTDIQAGRQARQDFRGKDGQRVLDPGARPGGDRGPGSVDRPGAGAVPKQLPSASPKAKAGPKAAPKAGAQPAQRPAQKAAPKPAQKAAQRPAQQSQRAAQRPSQPRRDTTYSHVQPRAKVQSHANRGRQSMSSRGGAPRAAGGRGGGRRSDRTLKHDIHLLGRLDNGIGFYRFRYSDHRQLYVGVMAQEVQTIAPDAVVRGPDGYLRVFYAKLGLPFQTYQQWLASGAQIPAAVSLRH